MRHHGQRDEKLIAHLRRLLTDLERIPLARREAECADTRGESVRALLAHYGRPAYRWTSSPDELATDAVMVGIGAADTAIIAAGLSYPEPTAGIYWPDCVTARGVVAAGGDAGPYPVPEALTLAHQLQEQWGFSRVVILLDEPGVWRDEWGRLAEQEGLV